MKTKSTNDLMMKYRQCLITNSYFCNPNVKKVREKKDRVELSSFRDRIFSILRPVEDEKYEHLSCYTCITIQPLRQDAVVLPLVRVAME
jgi:hypothetical protein